MRLCSHRRVFFILSSKNYARAQNVVRVRLCLDRQNFSTWLGLVSQL
jgi:hypothetical protein